MDASLLQLRNEQLRAALREKFGEINEVAWQLIHPSFEWKEINGGETLFFEGASSEKFYMVVSGRLQAVKRTEDGGQKVLSEIGRGESIGEMALLTDEKRSATIIALRDSVLVELSKTAFEQMLDVSPNMVRHLFENLITRLKQANLGVQKPPSIQTIAVVGISESIDLNRFCRRFSEIIGRRNKVALLDSAISHAVLGFPTDFSANEWHNRLTLWLNEMEGAHEFVIFEIDPSDRDWMNRCLRQADAVLLVADAVQSPDLTALEKTWMVDGVKFFTAHQYLILQHSAETKMPKGTIDWLKNRQVEHHFHLKKGDSNDFERLVRFVQGRSVGLVFAGGGARGLSHIGIFKALKEHGMPYDLVGGTSAGAIVAGCVARFENIEELLEKCRIVAMTNPVKNDFDLFPMISLLLGKKLRSGLDLLFEQQLIEDLWLEFFCVSSNLTTSAQFVHKIGPMERAIRASASIPGVFPPVVFGNDLHVDGGVINNLPIDVMRQLGAGRIIAADLDVDNEYELNYDEMPTAREVLKGRFLKNKKYETPSIVHILMKASVLGSNQKARELGATADLFFMPDLRNVGFSSWTEFDRVVEIGYEYGCRMLENVDEKAWK